MEGSTWSGLTAPMFTMRMTSCGRQRVSAAIGQPAEHLPHW